MSSISTVVIKKSEGLQDSRVLYQKTRYHIGFVPWCLWTLAAIIAAATAETTSNVTGVSVTFKVQDVIMMILTTCMLVRGLSSGNPYLVYPWIIISSWNIYNSQYPSLMKIYAKITRNKNVSPLAYIAFGIDALGTAVKVLLILRIIHLSINLWYQRKLQNETLGKM